jgi:2-aminobenzoate-CoA ligase
MNPWNYIPDVKLWPNFIFTEECSQVIEAKNFNLTWFLVDRHVKGGFGSNAFAIFDKKFYTYEYAYQASIRFANYLRKKGFGKGDRIAFSLLNSSQAVIVNFAIFRIGAISVPISPSWRPEIIEYLLRFSGTKCFIFSTRVIEKMVPIVKKIPEIKEVIVIKRNVKVEKVEPITAFYEDIIEREEDDYFLEQIDPFDPCVILFTSGTTGLPKGCVHLARGILCKCFQVNKYVWNLTTGDIITGASPCTFAAGFGTFVLIPNFAGATSLLFREFNPEELIEEIEEFKVTVLTGLTAFYRRLVKAPNFNPNKLKSVRLATAGGSHLDPILFQKWLEATGSPIYEGFGATEYLHLVASNAVNLKAKIGSFGISIPGVEIVIINDRGKEAKPGELGKMLVKGPTGPLYWANEKKQKESVIDGYGYIGDIIWRDESNYLHFACREEDIIIVNNVKYSPTEIEDCFVEHPLISDFGIVQDRKTGKIIACIVKANPEDDPESLKPKLLEEFNKTLKEKLHIDLKIDDIVIMNFLPRTPAGKLLRWKIRNKLGI